MWKFMKTFYEKFKTFDINLMTSICKDKWQVINYIMVLMDYEIITSNFDKYQKRLIELYDESEKENWVIEKIYDLANKLYVKSIDLEEFELKKEKIYKDADKIFKEGK